MTRDGYPGPCGTTSRRTRKSDSNCATDSAVPQATESYLRAAAKMKALALRSGSGVR